jgi:hypothetical protein
MFMEQKPAWQDRFGEHFRKKIEDAKTLTDRNRPIKVDGIDLSEKDLPEAFRQEAV